MIDIDPDRFRDTFEAYSRIGATEDGGLHRLALSDADREARDRFVADLEDLGLDVRVDEVGNVFGRRAGRDPDAAPVLIGSHLDSQPYGGRYDGQLGVLTALETLRAFDDAGVETDRPVEIVNWTNEEGARFAPALLGSQAFTGALPVGEALATGDEYGEGVTVGEELARIGYDGDVPCEPGGAFDVDSYLELHIEQGPGLDESGDGVGVVDGIFASTWLEVTVAGESDHAGPTPMERRRDAFATVLDAGGRILSLPGRLGDGSVACIGEVHVTPNKRNIIPREATFSVDFRAATDASVDRARDLIEAEVEVACGRHGTTFAIEERFAKERTAFAPRVVDAVADAAASVGAPYRHIESVSGHDAKALHEVADAGMIMVPSVDGVSHAEGEFTRMEDALDGAAVAANATYGLATE